MKEIQKSKVKSQKSKVISPIYHFTISPVHHFTSLLLLLITLQSTAQEIMTLPRALEIGLKNNLSIILQKNAEQIAKNRLPKTTIRWVMRGSFPPFH